MLISLLSLLTALLVLFLPALQSIHLNELWLASFFVLAGTTTLLLFPIMKAILFNPLIKLEQKLTPHLFKLLKNDHLLNSINFMIFLFPLISYLFAFALISLDFTQKNIVLALWIFFFGVNLDLLRNYLKRISRYMDPSSTIDYFTREAKKAIVDSKDDKLWSALDDLSEISLQAIKNNKIALCNQSLNAFPIILKTFFDSSKSISRINQDENIEKATGLDEASYTVFYILQRIELIFSKALDSGFSNICSAIIVMLGKIIVNCASFDLSMVTFPVHVLGKFALKALQYRFDEIGALATSTLLEVSKTIINDNDLTYNELKDPFEAIINNLDAIAQATFKKDKTLNIAILTQSLKDLKALFQSEKMINHRDTPDIIRMIDRVLADFEALQQVMRSLPPLTGLGG